LVTVIAMLLGVLAGLMGGAPQAVHPAAAMPVMTPIGVGPRFRLPAAGPAVHHRAPVGGLFCSQPAARVAAAHVELFANGRVLLLPPGIGVAPPVARQGARIVSGGCGYPLRTLDPTGVVWLGRGHGLTLGSLFAVWGQPLGGHRLAGFRARSQVRVYVDGVRRRGGAVRSTPLTDGAEIVVEIGRYVRPHTMFGFSGRVTT
jgi:hypothetical protein